jgi:peptidoglycan/xylan/chitin deacetylase (PgdA/CDA1 family)
MIAITIDCEQWNLGEIRGLKDRLKNNTLYSYYGNKKLLEIFEKYNIKATFFITSYFAEKHGKQVLEIIKKGHEIASHGHCHFYRNNKELNLEEDITKSKEIIEKLINKKVLGFRAPQMQFSLELIKILEKLDFRYDSSIHSANIPGFYNNKSALLFPYRIGKITEIPASASYKLRLPFSWTVFRNMPLKYSEVIIRKLIKKGIVPVIYFHSWEFYQVNEEGLRLDITRNTGEKLCKKIDRFFKKFKNEKFILMKDLVIN